MDGPIDRSYRLNNQAVPVLPRNASETLSFLNANWVLQ